MDSTKWQHVYVECAGDCGAEGGKVNFHAYDYEERPLTQIRWAIERWNERTPAVGG